MSKTSKGYDALDGVLCDCKAPYSGHFCDECSIGSLLLRSFPELPYDDTLGYYMETSDQLKTFSESLALAPYVFITWTR